MLQISLSIEDNSNDVNQNRDRFGYSINGGGVTWITTGTATSQMGSENIALNPGDVDP
ncbi:MAG: hypothetical protein R2784_10495 [Saprospiraceae bacterium]